MEILPMILLIAFSMAAYGGDAAAFTARWGPYPVGQQTVMLIDRQRNGREVVTEFWYPRAEVTPQAGLAMSGGQFGSPDRYRIPILRLRQEDPADPARVVRDAPAAPGLFPVVLFSHGLTAIRNQSEFLTRFWASHGFVVVACDHQGNTGYDFNPLQLYQSGLDRPRDLRFVLCQLWEMDRVAKWDLAGRLQLDRVAATGHSLGGFTALAFGGAKIRVKELPVQLDPGERPDFYEIASDRVCCVIALSPVYKPALTPEGLANLKRPTLVVGGTLDKVTPFEEHQRPIYQGLGGPGVLVQIDGASHFSFADENLLENAPFFLKAMHKPTIARADADVIIRSITLDFLNRHLKAPATLGWR